MHPSVHAESQPDKPAIVMAATGEVTTYAELEAQSNRVAQLLRSRDIGIEDPVAVCLDNDALYFPLAWGIAGTSSLCDELMAELNKARIKHGEEVHLKIHCLETALKQLVRSHPLCLPLPSA